MLLLISVLGVNAFSGSAIPSYHSLSNRPIKADRFGTAMRRSELLHERHKTNLAEPVTSKSWLHGTDKKFIDFAKNRVFQHNRPSTCATLLIARSFAKVASCFGWHSKDSHNSMSSS